MAFTLRRALRALPAEFRVRISSAGARPDPFAHLTGARRDRERLNVIRHKHYRGVGGAFSVASRASNLPFAGLAM
jgi:hypothetical protein